MALIWTNIDNGEGGLSVRNKLNTFNAAVVAAEAAKEQTITDLIATTNTHTTDIATNSDDIASLDVRLTAEEGPQDTAQFTPQLATPPHVEGQMYYDDDEGSLRVQGPIAGVEVSVGHSMHIHVVNNSGAIIEKGSAVRHNGVAAGQVQVVKALADTFTNARVFGIAQETIGIGAQGAIATFGTIRGLDTTGYPVGVPLYLSDTVAGTYTHVAPDIITQIGGAVVQDALNGEVFVSIINNTSLPTVLGGLKDQTPGNETYNVTTVVQDINDFLTEETIVSEVDALTGVITLPNDGEYRANFIASTSFPTSTSTRIVTFELYNVTTASVEFEYVVNIPRDTVADSVSMSYPFYGDAGQQYKARIKANTAIDITFDGIAYDIESVNIR